MNFVFDENKTIIEDIKKSKCFLTSLNKARPLMISSNFSIFSDSFSDPTFTLLWIFMLPKFLSKSEASPSHASGPLINHATSRTLFHPLSDDVIHGWALIFQKVNLSFPFQLKLKSLQAYQIKLNELSATPCCLRLDPQFSFYNI